MEEMDIGEEEETKKGNKWKLVGPDLKITDSGRPTTISPDTAKFLTILFENARPSDIAEVRNLYPSVGDVKNTDSVPKQPRYLAKHLIGVSISDFIEVLNGVVDYYPANRLKILVDKYKDNLEAALLAKDYDINSQRELFGKN
jgi:hypothetical protein